MPLQNSRSVSPGRGVMMKGTVRGKQRTGKKNRGGGEEGVDEKKDDRVGRQENGGKGKGKKIRGKGRRSNFSKENGPRAQQQTSQQATPLYSPPSQQEDQQLQTRGFKLPQHQQQRISEIQAKANANAVQTHHQTSHAPPHPGIHARHPSTTSSAPHSARTSASTTPQPHHSSTPNSQSSAHNNVIRRSPSSAAVGTPNADGRTVRTLSVGSNVMGPSPVLSAQGSHLETGVSPPLFERLVSDDVQELKSYSRIIQSQNARLSELERVNDDLERRLESQAKYKMEMEAEFSRMERLWGTRYNEISEERDAWKGAVEAERRRCKGLREQISRKDRELHRMLQRKYDSGRDSRAGSMAPQGGGMGGTTPVTALSGKISPDAKGMGGAVPKGGNGGKGIKRRDSKSPKDFLAENTEEEMAQGGGEGRKGLGTLFDFFGI